MVNTQKIRKDFPTLLKNVVYFDSGASSLTPSCVIEAESNYYKDYSCNIHRAAYTLSQEASSLYEITRERVKLFLSADKNSDVVFTKGTTDGMNHLAFGWAKSFLQPDDEIVLTDLEHHANFIPWNVIAQEIGCKIQYIPLTPDLAINENSLSSVINEKTKIVSIIGESNVTGYIPPLHNISKRAKEVGAYFIIDAAQYASHHKVDVKELGCDALVFSGHKICGPSGVGVLWAKNSILQKMSPLQYGGDMIKSVSKEKIVYADSPQKFEGGTPNIAGVIALKTAIDYVDSVGLENSFLHEQKLLSACYDYLANFSRIKAYGPALERRGGIFSFNIAGAHPYDVAMLLNQSNIAVRAGSHCAQPLMNEIGIEGTIRASFYFYNTLEEVDYFFERLTKIQEII